MYNTQTTKTLKKYPTPFLKMEDKFNQPELCVEQGCQFYGYAFPFFNFVFPFFFWRTSHFSSATKIFVIEKQTQTPFLKSTLFNFPNRNKLTGGFCSKHYRDHQQQQLQTTKPQEVPKKSETTDSIQSKTPETTSVLTTPESKPQEVPTTPSKQPDPNRCASCNKKGNSFFQPFLLENLSNLVFSRSWIARFQMSLWTYFLFRTPLCRPTPVQFRLCTNAQGETRETQPESWGSQNQQNLSLVFLEKRRPMYTPIFFL